MTTKFDFRIGDEVLLSNGTEGVVTGLANMGSQLGYEYRVVTTTDTRAEAWYYGFELSLRKAFNETLN